jgi:hypothetical protein
VIFKESLRRFTFLWKDRSALYLLWFWVEFESVDKILNAQQNFLQMLPVRINLVILYLSLSKILNLVLILLCKKICWLFCFYLDRGVALGRTYLVTESFCYFCEFLICCLAPFFHFKLCFLPSILIFSYFKRILLFVLRIFLLLRSFVLRFIPTFLSWWLLLFILVFTLFVQLLVLLLLLLLWWLTLFFFFFLLLFFLIFIFFLFLLILFSFFRLLFVLLGHLLLFFFLPTGHWGKFLLILSANILYHFLGNLFKLCWGLNANI